MSDCSEDGYGPCRRNLRPADELLTYEEEIFYVQTVSCSFLSQTFQSN